ncbi:MAG: acyl-[ACP]--phospholipid O-acyltransferase [Coxiellaceae bacterium]|nr:acyl-[ACP]--phospholipid O-acyltransferase [Coxiellaceae bacterium]
MSHSSLDRSISSYLMSTFCSVFVLFGHLFLLTEVISRLVGFSSGLWLLLGSVTMLALPFIILYSLAGTLADYYDKSWVQRMGAALTVGVSIWVLVCHWMGWLWLSYLSIILFSIVRALTAPARFAFVKQCYGKSFIARGNAWVVFVSASAVLFAIVIFSLLTNMTAYWQQVKVLHHPGAALIQLTSPATTLLVIVAFIQWFFACRLPAVDSLGPLRFSQFHEKLSEQSLRSGFNSMFKQPVVLACLTGAASFWSTSAVLFLSFPAFIHSQAVMASPFGSYELLADAMLGVVVGALYAGKLSKLFIESGYVMLAALGLTFSLLLFPTLESAWVIHLSFFIYGFFGGMLLVPVNALVQFSAHTKQLGRVIGAIGGIQYLAILVAVSLVVLAMEGGVSPVYLLHFIFVIALTVAILALYWVPQGLVRFVMYFVASRFFSIDVYGLENIPSSGPVLLLGNHTSFLDWAIIQIASPRPVRFAMSHDVYEKWYVRMMLQAFKIIVVGKDIDRDSINRINLALDEGEVVAIFPEGYLSPNGQIGTFHSDFEAVLAERKESVTILPFYLRGLWGTAASRATQRYRTINKIKTRRVSVRFGDPEAMTVTAPEIKKRVFELSILSWKAFGHSLGCIPKNWIRTAKKMANELSVADSTGIQLSHHKFIVAVLLVMKRLRSPLKSQQNIGLILPTSAGGAIANMAVLGLGKTVVNLNYTAGIKAMRSAVESAGIKSVVTSRLFLKKLTSRGIDLAELFSGIEVLYLENIKQENSKALALRYLIMVKLLPASILSLCFIRSVPSHTTAAIMFSSGSEGKPKGVELSHYNLLGNIKQVASIFNIEETDTFMCILPLFHCFGLTVTAFLPLIEGATFVCHPDPTDSVVVGHMVHRYKATILFGSSTFFGLYIRAKKLHSLMFKSLRMAIAGAEKLSPQVRQAFKDKFFLDIMEGYGTTEVAPVASCNLPDTINQADWHVHVSNKVGSVGLPLPGSAFRIVDPDSLDELPLGQSGMIAIGGPQVMKGYLNDPEKTHQVLMTDELTTWYLTGDKGYLDDEGYLYIVDRYSRFAKIGGEMVSLSVVEQEIIKLINETDSDAMAIAIRDSKKGERIALLYSAGINEDDLRRSVNASAIEKLMIPSFYQCMDELPKLASGKKDYVSAKSEALELFGGE